MTVLGLETATWATWRLRGRSRFQYEVHLQKARQRIGGILMQWHGRLGLQVPPASNQAFVDRLPLQPLARKTRRGLRSPSPGTPAWTLNPHARCADSCCPVQCPPAGVSTASTWLTGPYDCPPSAYPGLATQAVPYAAVAGGLPGLRGTAGPAPGRGTVLDCSST